MLETPAPPRSLSEQAYLAIRERIVTLQLRPGALIEERELIEDLQLGRTPIREALTRLVNEGLVTTMPRRGRVVSGISITDLAAIAEVRLELEGLAARVAAQRATDDERAAANAYLRALDELDADFSETTFMRLDQRIHRHIHRSTHNEFLSQTLELYLNLSLRLWYFRMDALAAIKDAAEDRPGMEEMRTILAAVIDADAKTAEETMRRHVSRFQGEVRDLLGPGTTA